MPAAQPKALRQRTIKTRGKHMHLADVAYAVAVGSYDVFDKMVRDSLSKDVLKLRTVRRFAPRPRRAVAASQLPSKAGREGLWQGANWRACPLCPPYPSALLWLISTVALAACGMRTGGMRLSASQTRR